MALRFRWNGCGCSPYVCLGLGLVVVLLISSRHCLASTEEYTLAGENCNKILRDKDAVAIKGSGGKRFTPVDLCDITVTSANNGRWMLRVQTAFILDCKVVVTVYDTPFATISLKPVLTISCASPDPGIIRMNSTKVMVRLLHKNASDFNFNLLFTARHVSPDRECPWFQCEGGADCIPKSVLCDGINNCFDSSDESKNGTAHCEDYWPFKGENWGVLASVLGAAVVLGVGAACCRHLRKRRDSFDDLYDLNEGPYVHKYAYQYRVIRHPAANSNHSSHHGRSHSSSSSSSHHHSHHTHHNHKRKDLDKDRAVRGKLLT